MPEAFKNLFNRGVIEGMGDHFSRSWADFPRYDFVNTACKGLDALELKQRSEQIMGAMEIFLPDDFPQAADIMMSSLAPVDCLRDKENTIHPEGISGWAIMPMTHYVGKRGLDHFDLSMSLLREMTKRFTSEFGIRFFIQHDPDRCLKLFREWVNDSNEHVRRLVSEGTRPRLPWAMQLTDFVTDPKPVLPLLEFLKDDQSEYVRRSVANHLNDISKDHPNLVAEVAEEWLQGDVSRERYRLVKHACRTLIKQGHRRTLKAFGYRNPRIAVEQLNVNTPIVHFGDYLEFELLIQSCVRKEQPLIIDYAIHHQKANGELSPKVFKWKTVVLDGESSLEAVRRHPMREISTRKYYAGSHLLEILINGKSVARQEFELRK